VCVFICEHAVDRINSSIRWYHFGSLTLTVAEVKCKYVQMLFIVGWTVVQVCNFYCEEIRFEALSFFSHLFIHKNLFVAVLAENMCSS